MRQWLSIPFVVCLGVAMAGCTTVENPVTGKEERSAMSAEQEKAEGRKAHPQILQEYGELRNPALQAYVREVGQRLAKASHRPELEWTFTVLDSPEINAFALPGGYVYVTRGIMAYMHSEADLAGVLGHEIGHVTARHGAQRATRQQTAGLGVLAATILGAVLESSGLGGATDLASQVSQGVAAGYVAKYSREQELQADKLGAEYLDRVDFDPRNMVDVIQLLANQERFSADIAKAEGRAPRESSWLDSHPTSDKRLEEIQQIAAEYKKKSNFADERRARYLQAVDGLPFGESREQGVTRGRNFFHEPLGLALTAPEGWRIQNSPESVALVAGDGSAGLVVQAVPPKAGTTHEEIIRNVVKPQSGRTEQRSLNGLPATHFQGTVGNAQGQQQNVMLTVATGPQQRNYLLLYAAKDATALQRALPGLRAAESSFRALSAADRQAAQPWTLRSVSMPRGGFAELARQAPPTLPRAEAQLRLLNGVYGGGEVPAGQPVKTVR